MEFLMDPSIWAGLLTLVVLEIVLGIDNLVFIAILADKLPPKQRDKARLLGLSLALIMRLGLLSLISWMVTLTKPLFTVMDFSFSGRDLIMLFGGIFLLFKATTELHERLENRDHDSGHGKGYASFWVVVTQIVILDAVFSLDAVITAVGMVNHLPVMMAAVEGDTLDPEVERRYRNALSLQAPCPDIIRINRFAFYERAQKAFAIVITGERAKYGNILLKKGVTP